MPLRGQWRCAPLVTEANLLRPDAGSRPVAVAKKTLIEEFQNPKSKRKKVRRRYAIALHERPLMRCRRTAQTSMATSRTCRERGQLSCAFSSHFRTPSKVFRAKMPAALSTRLGDRIIPPQQHGGGQRALQSSARTSKGPGRCRPLGRARRSAAASRAWRGLGKIR